MAKPDPILAQIVNRFARFDVRKIGGGYILHDHHDGSPVARLKPFSQTDDFELFYWAIGTQRWRTFGPLGPFKLTLDEIQEIIEHESIFRRRRSLLSRIFR